MGRVVDTGIASGPLATWWGAERERGGAKGEGGCSGSGTGIVSRWMRI